MGSSTDSPEVSGSAPLFQSSSDPSEIARSTGSALSRPPYQDIHKSPNGYGNGLRSPIFRGDEFNTGSKMADNASEIIDIIHDSEARKFRVGIILIVIAVATWMVGLELVNVVLKGGTYQKPFLFAYITGSCFVLNFIPDLIKPFKRETQEPEETPNPYDTNPATPLTKREVTVLAIQVSIIYYLYNVAALSCLKYTSASNQTVLSSTTSIFTLVLGSFLKFDSFTIKKTVCTVVSFTGVVLVNFSEQRSGSGDGGNKFIPKNPSLGNSLAVVGALMYAFYLMIMKAKCGTGDKTTNERKLFGWVGLYTMLLGIPVLFLVDQLGIELFEFPPPSTSILVLILINGVFSYISDFTTVLALMLTSPLITSLSLTSSVPITIFIDYMILFFSKSDSPSPPNSRSNAFMYVMGITSILSSVILINLNSTTENELIEQVIDRTLDEAIRDDEMLSPVLSPILSSRPHSNFGSPLLTIRRVPSKNKVTSLSLEGSQLVNKNHSSKLYTVNREESEEESTGSGSNMVVYGGNNHIYHVKHVDS